MDKSVMSVPPLSIAASTSSWRPLPYPRCRFSQPFNNTLHPPPPKPPPPPLPLALTTPHSGSRVPHPRSSTEPSGGAWRVSRRHERNAWYRSAPLMRNPWGSATLWPGQHRRVRAPRTHCRGLVFLSPCPFPSLPVTSVLS